MNLLQVLLNKKPLKIDTTTPTFYDQIEFHSKPLVVFIPPFWPAWPTMTIGVLLSKAGEISHYNLTGSFWQRKLVDASEAPRRATPSA
jgi:hypothetical protein